MGKTQVSIYVIHLQTKYKLLSKLIRITDFIKNIATQSVCLFAIEMRCTVCSYGTSTAYFVTYVIIRGTMNNVHRKACFCIFSYLLSCVFVTP